MPEKDYPHLNDTAYPYLSNVNVYQYQNDFNYQRWGENVTLNVYSLGINEDNVPYFETIADRNAWFDSKECYTQLTSSYINVLPNELIKLPIPFDVMNRCNYLEVIFPIMTSEGQPIDYESTKGVRRYYYYIKDIQYSAPNTTLCLLAVDWWTTFINYCQIDYLMLERGHAPLAVTNADNYLANPLNNNNLLLSPDVNYGTATNLQTAKAISLNDKEIYALISTSANPLLAWGSKAGDNWNTPTSASLQTQDAPSFFTFALKVEDLTAFLQNIDTQVPQFKQTINGVYFIAKKLITLGQSFTFAGITCYRNLNSQGVELPLITLEKSQFNYDSSYADLAKLYTYPYAQLEITYSDGQVTLVNIEDTTGKLSVQAIASIAYPAPGIDTFIKGVGGVASQTLTFQNLNERSYQFAGRWYQTLKQWAIPMYNVIQSNAITNDYATDYDRKQQVTAYTNAYNSALDSANTALQNAYDSADTAKANADASADTSKANADASADTMVTNTANSGATQNTNINLAVTTNTANQSDSNACSVRSTGRSNSLNQALQAWDAGLERDLLETDNRNVGLSVIANTAGNMAQAMMNPNPIEAGVGLAGALISGVSQGVNAAIALNAQSEKIEATITNSQMKLNETNGSTSEAVVDNTSTIEGNLERSNTAMKQQTANNVNTANQNANNSAATAKGNASRSQATAKANASRSQATAKGNALRSYNTALNNASRSRNTAQQAIENSLKQAALAAPNQWGENSATIDGIVKPISAHVNVVTQSKSAIKQTADYFKRYGYALMQQWEVSTFNVMPKFSYWKASEVWINSDSNVIQRAKDAIINTLTNGVTVWRNPDEIGKVSIYDN